MPSVDEIWEWIYQPVQELKRDCSATPDTPWETRRETFLSELGLSAADQDPAIEELLRKLDEMPDADRKSVIGSDQLDNLAYEVAARHGVAVGSQAQDGAHEQGQQGGGAEQSYDEDKWQAFLEQYGPHWDGTAGSWDQFKEWFLYYAREGGFEAPASSLLDYLTTQDVAGRIATLATYGVVIAPAAQAHQGDDAPVTESNLDGIMAELAEDPEWGDIPEERRRELIAEALREAQAGDE